MKRWISYFVAATALALMAGCSTVRTFPSQVTVFSDWPGDTAKSYVFTRSAEQDKSLEHKTYEGAVREVLASKGFNEVAGKSGAKYAVALSYGVNQDKNLRQITVEDSSYPYWGGPYWRPYFGLGFRSRHWGGFASFPIVYQGYETPIFSRELKIDISELATGAKRYEATARNDSRYDSLTGALPYLARAALDGFPQANGSVRVVRIPVPEVKEAVKDAAKDTAAKPVVK
jgi:Domain of unknown function (DUF4136)